MDSLREEIYVYMIEYPTTSHEERIRKGFQAIVKKKFIDNIPIGITINIGGAYEKCIEMSVIFNNGKPTGVKINNILSEPECGVLTLMEQDKTEYMIKCALQFIKNFDDFKDINTFELDDMSHIYCDIDSVNYSKTYIPRKGKYKLGLPFFYIAYHQKSWYEDKFGATLIDYSKIQNPTKTDISDKKYKEYRLQMENFNNPINLSFFDFASVYGFSIEQYKELEKYYDPLISFKEFFSRIKNNRCHLLYNWIESCVQNIINNSFYSNIWEIDYNKMNKVVIGKIYRVDNLNYDKYMPFLKNKAINNIKTYTRRKYKGGSKNKLNRHFKKNTRKNIYNYRMVYSPEESL